MGISPWSDSHHDNDSDNDEDDDQPTAHPLARVLLVLLGLDKLIHARLHMVSGLAHLSTAIIKCGERSVKKEEKEKDVKKKKKEKELLYAFGSREMSVDWEQVGASVRSKLSSCNTNK